MASSASASVSGTAPVSPQGQEPQPAMHEPVEINVAEMRRWIERSAAHTRVWDDFSRGTRTSDKDPVIVDQKLLVTFHQVREALLVDEVDRECELCPLSRVGLKGQSWSVRSSPHFEFVVVRVAPDLDSRQITIIMPRQQCIQRGAVVTMRNGIVRMPIYPRGWITYSAEEVGGVVFLDSVGGWTCHECTLDNPGEASTCFLCETVRRLNDEVESSSHSGSCAPAASAMAND
jgi:hypothetical protein